MSSVSFLGAQNAPKSLAVRTSFPDLTGKLMQRSPDPKAGFKGPTSKALTSKGVRWEGKKGKGREEAQNDLCPGARNPRAATELSNPGLLDESIEYSRN